MITLRLISVKRKWPKITKMCISTAVFWMRWHFVGLSNNFKFQWVRGLIQKLHLCTKSHVNSDAFHKKIHQHYTINSDKLKEDTFGAAALKTFSNHGWWNFETIFCNRSLISNLTQSGSDCLLNFQVPLHPQIWKKLHWDKGYKTVKPNRIKYTNGTTIVKTMDFMPYLLIRVYCAEPWGFN